MTAQNSEAIHLLEQVRSDFDRARFDLGPVAVTLVHTATNVTAEGVVGHPAPDPRMVAGGGAGHRDGGQRFDKTGQPLFRPDPILDVNGQPIVNSAGEAFDLVMPAFRTVTFCGTSSDYKKVANLAERAGRLIPRFANVAPPFALAGWRFSSPQDLWWAVVFELAWTKRHPFLTAERRIWLPSPTPTYFLPYDIEQLRCLAKVGFGLEKSIPPGWLKRLPEAFISQLDNIAAASFDTADYLLAQLKPLLATAPGGPAAAALAPGPASAREAIMRRRFAVAVSFPGEQREIVEPIANALADAFDRSRVFYDRFHEIELSKPNLDLALQRFYGVESDLIVIFVCGEYQAKEWCGLEWRAIRQVMKEKSRADEDIMFLRLDNKSLEGMLSLDGFLDISGWSSRQVADAIIKRWTTMR